MSEVTGLYAPVGGRPTGLGNSSRISLGPILGKIAVMMRAHAVGAAVSATVIGRGETGRLNARD